MSHLLGEQRRALLGEISGPVITITSNQGTLHDMYPIYLVTVWLPSNEASVYGTSQLAVRACDSTLTIAMAAAKAEYFRRIYGRKLPVFFNESALADFLDYRISRYRGDINRMNASLARKIGLGALGKEHVCAFMKLRYSYALSQYEQEEAAKARRGTVIDSRWRAYPAAQNAINNIAVQIGELS